LLALEQGDNGKAVQIYLDRIQPGVTLAAPLNAMTDGVSLLWRLQASGHRVPEDAWRDLAAYAERRFPRAGNSFIDVHMAMLAAMTGNWTALQARIADLDVRRASGRRVRSCRTSVARRGLSPGRIFRPVSGYCSRLPPRWCGSAAATRNAR
jgi:hypothetical protein